MADLKELRKWARGGKVKGLPSGPAVAPKKRSRSLDRIMKAKAAAAQQLSSRTTARFQISAEGDDALILFGKHNGRVVSAIHEIEPSYLTWLKKQDDMPQRLKDVVRHVQGKKK